MHQREAHNYATDTFSHRYLFEFQKLQQFCMKHPTYTRKFCTNQLSIKEAKGADDEEEPTLERERIIWKHFSQLNKQSRWYFILSGYYFFVVLKYFAYAYYTICSTDHKEGLNLIDTTKEHEFVCMRTNCTQLSSDKPLATDLVKLPVFSICNQHLIWLYNPIINTGELGLMLMALVVFGVLVMVVLVPIYDALVPTENRTLMFLMCPNLSVRLEHKRTMRLWKRLLDSYENCQIKQGRTQREAPHRLECQEWQQYFNSMRGTTTTTTTTTSKYCRQPITRQMLIDCLPVNSTSWWHQKLLMTTPATGTLIVANSLLIYLAFNLYLNLIAFPSYKQSFSEYSQFMRLANCSIWLVDQWETTGKTSNGGQKSTIDLEAIVASHKWTVWTIFEFAFGSSLALFNITATTNCFYQSINEIQLAIVELQMRLRVAIELARLRLVGRQQRHVQSGWPMKKADGQLRLEELRRRPHGSFVQLIRDNLFYKQTSYSLAMLRVHKLTNVCGGRPLTGAKQLDSSLAYQQFAINLIEVQNANDQTLLELQFVDLLEKIQINYWHLMELIRDFYLPLYNVLLFTNVINFGFCIISVYFYRMFTDTLCLPLVVNLVAVVAITTYIAWASTVHCEARKLQPLFWSLAGLTSNDPDPRVAHLKHLWNKQMDLVDAQGGLSLRALGGNVTYVGILQTLVWTTSIMLFAYSRR